MTKEALRQEIDTIDKVVKNQWQVLDALIKEHDESLERIKREINTLRDLCKLREEDQKKLES
jgi:nitrate reductase NapAB chaperone NapD